MMKAPSVPSDCSAASASDTELVGGTSRSASATGVCDGGSMVQLLLMLDPLRRSADGRGTGDMSSESASLLVLLSVSAEPRLAPGADRGDCNGKYSIQGGRHADDVNGDAAEKFIDRE